MFRSSRLVRSLQRSLHDASATRRRGFSYQKDLYLKSFEDELTKSDPAIAALRRELKAVGAKSAEQPNLARLISAYRQFGHLRGKTNPLESIEPCLTTTAVANGVLDPAFYGLDRSDSRAHPVSGLLFGSSDKMTLAEIESYLQKTYSSEMTLEMDHLLVEEEKLWLAKEFEALGQKALDKESRLAICKLLLKSQAFDHFLAAKFPTFKRYSLEGGESAMAFYESLFMNSSQSDISEMVMGIAHRGRLNLMTIMLGLSPTLLFTKIKGKSEYSPDVKVTGDIAHHFPCSVDLTYGQKSVHVSLLPNPSHLEAVDPLVLGKARSKQMYAKDSLYADQPSFRSNKVASFLVHGDGAFSGQGIVTETFQLSKLANYSVGGTVHLIINNQLAFTLPCSLGRSSIYNSDLSKSVGAPVIRCNGDNPEQAFKAAELALKYRNMFGKDVVVDMLCFRKYGHNELDEPMFTNPLIYKKIQGRQSVPDAYLERLAGENLVQKSELDSEVVQFKKTLEDSFAQVDSYKIEPRNTYLQKKWSGMDLPATDQITKWETGLNAGFLRHVGSKSVEYPKDFAVHSTVERGHIKKRLEKLQSGQNIDWSTAESLAFGSLLMQGFTIRLSGQDVGRGTFSQRHAMLVDQKTAQTYIPLNNIDKDQKSFLEICNSHLSEEAVMGYEYGYSLDDPRNLVIWEAQFGDFFNGAQIIIDTYIAPGETKWLHQSGLVLMLPHGFDGAASEHSSCRIERFLQMTNSKEDAIDADNINFYFANPTTPANYFHVLRRQMVTPFRKPLIMASPKGLLRLPECVSNLDEFAEGTMFQPVLDDPSVKLKSSVKKVIFVSGKVYYEFVAEKLKRSRDDIAFIRLEQLSPFPVQEIRSVLSQYKNAKEFVYAQEEHRNMGAFSFVAPRFENILGIKLKYIGREVAATISGIGALHKKELQELMNGPFEK